MSAPAIHAVVQDAGILQALGGMAVGLVLLRITCLSFIRDLWALSFVIEQRRKSATWIAVPLALILFAAGIAIFGTKHPAACLFPVFAIGPWLTIKIVAWWAWRTDNQGTRTAALAIRTAEASRIGEPVPVADRKFPWPGYIFDVARAEQRALYEPPPI